MRRLSAKTAHNDDGYSVNASLSKLHHSPPVWFSANVVLNVDFHALKFSAVYLIGEGSKFLRKFGRKLPAVCVALKNWTHNYLRVLVV
jgi:hypothetical protein